MDPQSNPQNSQGFDQEKKSVSCHRPILMQEVEIDAAAVWVEDRCGHQMIQVYQDGREKDQYDSQPVLFKKKHPYSDGQDKMYAVMKKESKHRGRVMRVPVSEWLHWSPR